MASLVSIVGLKRDAGSLSLRTCIVRSLFPAVSPYIKQPIALLRLWSVLPTFLSYAKGIPTGQCPKLACSNNQSNGKASLMGGSPVDAIHEGRPQVRSRDFL